MMNRGTCSDLPFCVIRNSAQTLVEQTFDGLKGAILCGHYKPGDVLPPMRVFTERLGVSRIVMNEVIVRLKAEGLVNARPRVGCVVLETREKLWKGKVLIVNPIGDDNLAEGALLAMAECGIRIPEDVGEVTWANYGSGPVFGRPLARMEMNPISDGRKSAAWILGILSEGARMTTPVLGPKYICGDTLQTRKRKVGN